MCLIPSLLKKVVTRILKLHCFTAVWIGLLFWTRTNKEAATVQSSLNPKNSLQRMKTSNLLWKTCPFKSNWFQIFLTSYSLYSVNIGLESSVLKFSCPGLFKIHLKEVTPYVWLYKICLFFFFSSWIQQQLELMERFNWFQWELDEELIV